MLALCQHNTLAYYAAGIFDAGLYSLHKYKEKLEILQSIGIIARKSKETRVVNYVHLQIVIVIVIKALQCMAGYNYSRKVNSINLIMH